jgi:hypothetical protein
MKQLNTILLLITLLFAAPVNAEPSRIAEMEVHGMELKLSNDGTGIIKGVTCKGCGYKIGTITENTKAYVDAKNVDILRVRERAGKSVFVRFVRSTGEITGIYW